MDARDVLYRQQPRAAFVYLAHPERARQLRESLQSLQKHFMNKFPGYQVLVYHEKTDVKTPDLATEIPAKLQLISLDTFAQFPDGYFWEPHHSQQRW